MKCQHQMFTTIRPDNADATWIDHSYVISQNQQLTYQFIRLKNISKKWIVLLNTNILSLSNLVQRSVLPISDDPTCCIPKINTA